MPDKILTGNNGIHADRWYYESDLLLMLGISADAQQRAREAGKLKYVNPAGTSTYLYRGEWVLEWLDGLKVQNGPSREQRIIERSNRRLTGASTSHQLQSADVPAGSPITSQRSTMSQPPTNPIQEWNRRLAEKVSAGMPKRKAVLALAREDPELHKRFLIVVNARRGNRGGVNQLLGL